MKNLILTATLFCFAIANMNAQFSFGIKASASPTFSPNTNHLYANQATPRTEFAFNIAQVSSSISAGVFADLELNESFFIRGEAMYSKYETSYKTYNTWNEQERSSSMKMYNEKTTRLDVPISLGVHLGNVEITSGIMAHIILDNENEMASMDGYAESLDKIQLGIQTGVGINLSNVILGLAYQMDFQNYADHINVNGKNLALLNSPSRLVASIAYRF